MLRTLLTGKIHRATVTEADLHYVGSITIDAALLEAANMLPFERVQVVNVNTGARWETYTIVAERGSGVIKCNGAAARLASPGDLVIIMGYAQVSEPIPADWSPRVVLVNEKNQISEVLDFSPKGMAPRQPEPAPAFEPDKAEQPNRRRAPRPVVADPLPVD
jgi:aspartate 1-decarboxylase